MFGYGFGSPFSGFGLGLGYSSPPTGGLGLGGGTSSGGSSSGDPWWAAIVPSEQIVEEAGDLASDLVTRGDTAARDALGLPGSGEQSGQQSSGAAIPRWAKWLGIGVLVLLVIEALTS